MGLVSPLMRELRETEYPFSGDFVMDSSAAQATFTLRPTPWEEVIAGHSTSQGPAGRASR